jgi:hypothetical protein
MSLLRSSETLASLSIRHLLEDHYSRAVSLKDIRRKLIVKEGVTNKPDEGVTLRPFDRLTAGKLRARTKAKFKPDDQSSVSRCYRSLITDY